MEITNKNKYFLSLLEPIFPDLSNFCWSMENEEHAAKDLISDTILVAFENVDKLNDVSAFKYYLFGIASRLSKKRFRKQKRLTKWDNHLDETLISQEPSPGLSHDVAMLYKALDKLAPNMKEAVILFEISGFSIKEICEIQGSSTSAVKQRLKRGREKLANLLKE